MPRPHWREAGARAREGTVYSTFLRAGAREGGDETRSGVIGSQRVRGCRTTRSETRKETKLLATNESDYVAKREEGEQRWLLDV